jgi:hypothetical protein
VTIGYAVGVEENPVREDGGKRQEDVSDAKPEAAGGNYLIIELVN